MCFVYIYIYTFILKLNYPKNDLNVYDFISINLKIILSTNSSTRIFINNIRPEWFEHSSELSWAACFAN
jgi:hypothetical protein